MIRGTVKDDGYFIFICCADKDEDGTVDFTNPVQHEKANPNYGVTNQKAIRKKWKQMTGIDVE